ncbi:4-hydroxy-3-methylbut-2-enyl diphosphate reductase [Haoranjiania flava]|uniref:4-hydroxy-3-methylbut-2-enyl diphosphate reductase n=1 Tax=Haoranjiania flava TaxID=1856322 RepID=A0AAE3LJR9_9BACT|nr:4-hydroxy-3-methylbut-2-enyl diphosphate reductase [Haoranjiania flava]MCU7694047.1 4-hydroxy-3-methylbut-2-enyl diphosphate reductase [Haoranjiania flava]
MKKFKVPNIYRSPLISAIKERRRIEDKLKKDFTPTLLDFGTVQIYLARHFGFCYGVENAIEIAFETIENNAGKNIYLLSEMIHNPQVNKDLEERGVQFIQDTYGRQVIPFEKINGDDIVLIPAFGTTLEIEKVLQEKGIQTEKYNTTCPFVEKVWNRSAQIAEKGYSIIVHGKPKHEETRATFSHASSSTHTIVINDMKEAEALAAYIRKEKPAEQFYTEFAGRFSEGFDVEKDLQKIGVVNQTTQLASETQAISDFFKEEIKKIYGSNEEEVRRHFADTRDTLCYATNDNQNAVRSMLETDADVAIVVGGYNSSNTSHLVELCDERMPTFFINGEDKIISKSEIVTCNWKTKEITHQHNFLPEKELLKILVTSGASCPDSIVEQVIKKILKVCGLEARYDETLAATAEQY